MDLTQLKSRIDRRWGTLDDDGFDAPRSRRKRGIIQKRYGLAKKVHKESIELCSMASEASSLEKATRFR